MTQTWERSVTTKSSWPMLTTWPRFALRPVMTPAIGAGTVTSETIWLGFVSASTCARLSPRSKSRWRAASTSVAWLAWLAVISSRS